MLVDVDQPIACPSSIQISLLAGDQASSVALSTEQLLEVKRMAVSSTRSCSLQFQWMVQCTLHVAVDRKMRLQPDVQDCFTC
jgi:hypothetical protein